VDGLQLAVAEDAVAAFLLAAARTAGFVLVTPPFSTRTLPVQARTGVAIALALPLAAALQPSAPPLGSTAIVLQMVLQVVLGAAFGFFVLVAVATVQAVGDLIDLVGGFSMAIAVDPLMLVQASVFGRLHQLVAATLLFTTDAHLMVIQGLSRSMGSTPTPVVDWDQLGAALTRDVAGLLLSALQVAGPVVAVMLVADVALGLLTRAAPALNAFALSAPLKILFTLLLAGLVVARLPEVLEQLVEHAVITGIEVASAEPGGGP
jgi:flagellar biosynthetic protein FliR